MTWEEKFQALAAIGNISLHMRKPGDWYVRHDASLCWSQFKGGPYGNGTTPQEAVENHWEIFTTLKAPGYSELRAVLASVGGQKKEVRWNGFMWCEC